jgi:hypothetical protein
MSVWRKADSGPGLKTGKHTYFNCELLFRPPLKAFIIIYCLV